MCVHFMLSILSCALLAACGDDGPATTDGGTGCAAELAACDYRGQQLDLDQPIIRMFTDPMTGRELVALARFPVGAGPYPVVIWSHGGGLDDNGHLGNQVWSNQIAANGYIVVHVAHVSLTLPSRAALCALASVPQAECIDGTDPDDEEAPFVTIARPRDVIALLDQLPAMATAFEAAGKPAVDTTKVVLAGWSAGTRAAMALFGAARRLSPSIQRFTMPDPRPIAAVTLSPAGPGYFGFFEGATTSWDGMRGPLFVLTGTNDVKPAGSPGASRRQAYELQPADGQRRLLYSNLAEGIGGHGTYNLDDLTSSDERLSRLSRALRSSVLAYLDAVVHDDLDAKAWLASDHATILAGDVDWETR